jgi:hypothetical protein
VINALAATATKITDADTPYVWAGGHAEAGVASVGSKGPGHNGKRVGFDCSGAVAAVLVGAGLWPAGAGVPADNGVISELMSEHLIARGVGAAPDAVTLYDDPGVHIFMNIDGRFFGTSDGSGGGDAEGGAGWLDDGAYDASDRTFKKYHFLPSVLEERTSYGNDFTFDLPLSGLFAATNGAGDVSLGDLGISDLLAGERVRVTYTAAGTGAMTAQSVAVISGGPTLPVPPTTSTTTTTTPNSGPNDHHADHHHADHHHADHHHAGTVGQRVRCRGEIEGNDDVFPVGRDRRNRSGHPDRRLGADGA